MQEILGHVAFSFSFRKIFMSLLHRSYKFVESLPERSWRPIPPDIIDEFRAVSLHLPIACRNLGAPLAREIWATDATPSPGGSTVARASSSICKKLHSRAETRGANLRLDASASDTDAQLAKLLPVDDEVNAIAAVLP